MDAPGSLLVQTALPLFAGDVVYNISSFVSPAADLPPNGLPGVCDFHLNTAEHNWDGEFEAHCQTRAHFQNPL